MRTDSELTCFCAFFTVNSAPSAASVWTSGKNAPSPVGISSRPVPKSRARIYFARAVIGTSGRSLPIHFFNRSESSFVSLAPLSARNSLTRLTSRASFVSSSASAFNAFRSSSFLALIADTSGSSAASVAVLYADSARSRAFRASVVTCGKFFSRTPFHLASSSLSASLIFLLR